MDRRRMNRLTIAFIAVVVLTVSLMLAGSMRPASHIVLPGEQETPGENTGDTNLGGDALTVVEVTPDTVQAAIATLARPEAYCRIVRIQQFWDGGNGGFDISVAVSGSWTRTDRVLPSGQTRHALTDGESTYIWYDSSQNVYIGPAGTISADNEQVIPTYEEILQLSPDQISTADYRMIAEDVNCIYVETAKDADGYTLRYWVSVDNGLLVAAEKLLEDETIYRMSGLLVDLTAPKQESFTLPDGTILTSIRGESR
jgi:hypothetical protein